ncbi:MAG: hypothetical protein JO107_11400 [Hyphomicrobiales bacterium]|nr:hypothetical protein [Hyphomicrobiales bacterium]
MLAGIVERADGVPLFIEELTKAALETARETPKGAQTISAKSSPKPSVPSTLHDALMARLDRLGQDAKEIAQVASAIGREFSYELLALVAQRSDAAMQAALHRLIELGLVLPQGAPSDETYFFRYALVRDAAYDAILRTQRRQLHARIAEVLESSAHIE